MIRCSVINLILAGALVVALCSATCDFCGRECSKACGTNYFRTCCLNYLRKRSGPPGLHLELMLLPPDGSAVRGHGRGSAEAGRLRDEREHNRPHDASGAAARGAPVADDDGVQFIYSV
uniref:Trissin n=1 Tax=Locusta migratoria TaxID=7004 RepID=A0A0H3YI81_LOCMI|nr:trissin precursor [Locusta migratoria]